VSGKLIGRLPSHRVLVTGCPRSGTTFVGRVLALPATVDYLHEPLNPACGVPSVRSPYVDLTDPRRADVASELEGLLEYRTALRGATYERDDRLRRVLKRAVPGRGPANLAMARINPWSKHVIIKDPFAARSIEWFADRDVEVVALLRHPAAVAASYRRLGWDGPPADLLRGSDNWSDDELCELERARSASGLEAAAAVWAVVTRRLVRDRRVRVVLHEQLSAEPAAAFAELREQLGLPWTRLAARRLERMTSGRRGVALAGRTQQMRRSSTRISDEALASLRDAELRAIWRVAGDVASRWYGPAGIA
jgi:hypothetical protein